MSDKQDDLALKVLQLKKQYDNIKDDATISKDDRSAIDQLSDANWDLLRAMRSGVHYKQQFDCLGVPLYLRPLTSDEEIKINNTLMERGLVPNTSGVYELEKYKLMLSEASTRHPVLTQGEYSFLSLSTLGNMPSFLLRELGMNYIDFLGKCNLNKLEELNTEQVDEVLDLLIKKQIAWSDLPFMHRVQTMNCLIERYQILLEQLDKLTTQS